MDVVAGFLRKLPFIEKCSDSRQEKRGQAVGGGAIANTWSAMTMTMRGTSTTFVSILSGTVMSCIRLNDRIRAFIDM